MPQKDAEHLIRNAIQRSTCTVTTLLKPDVILDIFEERNVFGDTTSAIDIRAISIPSQKSRAIYDRVSRDWRLYLVFKECLAATRQTDLLNALEKTEEDLHTEMKDAQNRLIALYNRHCQKVPVYPLSPEDREHIKQLYVKPSMIEMSQCGVRVSANKASNTETDKMMKEIRDIFYSDEESYNNIYIVAECGSGKTTLCEFLVYLWIKEHTAMVRKGEASRDESFMADFAFLFYISLREANIQSTCNIEDMIRAQLELEDMDVSKLILDYTCLVILDGLDEYSLKHKENTRFICASLPWRRYSDRCTIITTSRPWKIELLAGELRNHIDRLIRIIGLEPESQKDLVRNVINILNSKDKQTKKFKDFIRSMKKQHLDKYMKTPILLLQMLGLWFDGESFGKSQCEIYSKMIDKQIQFAAEVKKIPAASNTEEAHKAEMRPLRRGLLIQSVMFLCAFALLAGGSYVLCCVACLSFVLYVNFFSKQHSGTSSGEEPHSAQVPVCFNGLGYCQTYRGLLLKLSKLAYHLLFGSQNSVLVFDHGQMDIIELGLSEEDIQHCLNMGLLTQYKVLGKRTQKKEKSISFVHKSHQEFFAAIYLWQTLDLKQLLDSVTDLDRALQIEKVLTFVAGMNMDVSVDIAKVIVSVASSDSRTEQYRESCDDSHTTLIKQMQCVVFAAIEESRCYGRTMPAILLQDIWMRGGDRDFPPSRILACSQSLHISQLKSICIDTPSDSKECEAIWRLVKKSSQKLLKIVLCHCEINKSVLQEVVKRKRDSLKAIGLYYVSNFSLLDNATLTWIVSASSIELKGVELTHEQLVLAYKQLGRRPHVQVALENIRCTLHDNSCEVGLDLSTSPNLHKLKLRSLPIQEVVFMPDSLLHCEIWRLSAVVTTSIIRCLRAARNLEIFKCCNDTFSASANQEILRTLPHLNALTKIILRDIDLTSAQLHVFPSHLKALEEITLRKVTLTATQLRQLLAALPSHKTYVRLWDAIIIDYDINDNIIEKTAASHRTSVLRKPELTYEIDKCVVIAFYFFHKRYCPDKLT